MLMPAMDAPSLDRQGRAEDATQQRSLHGSTFRGALAVSAARHVEGRDLGSGDAQLRIEGAGRGHGRRLVLRVLSRLVADGRPQNDYSRNRPKAVTHVGKLKFPALAVGVERNQITGDGFGGLNSSSRRI